MNFKCVYIIFTLVLFVKLKSTEAKRVRFQKGGPLTNSRSKNHKYHRLNPPRFDYYYNLLTRPFLKRHLFKLLKNKKYDEARPFVDLTRDDYAVTPFHYGNINKFSEDYIDTSELARYTNAATDDYNRNYKLKPEQNKKILIDIHGNSYQVLKLLDKIARRMLPYQQRSNAFRSDSDESSSSSESVSHENSKHSDNDDLNNKARTRISPKRFQVINNNSEETESDDDNYSGKINNGSVDTNDGEADENDYDNEKRYQIDSESKSDELGTSDQFIYVQSPIRHVKTSDVEWRRRLKNFLPKRVHWDMKDFQNLRNYWIDGPRGRYPAQYKTPY